MKALIDYWFGDPVELVPDIHRRGLWFKTGEEQDRQLRKQFGALVEQAVAGELSHWLTDGQAYLALVLLLDQLPRNIWRGTDRAYSGDARALATAEQAIDLGLDRKLPVVQRTFLYMPFEHQESQCAQDRCIALMELMVAESRGAQREVAQSFCNSALEHQQIIRRFGRFPHRNAFLARRCTDDEAAYLASGAKTFGQQ